MIYKIFTKVSYGILNIKINNKIFHRGFPWYGIILFQSEKGNDPTLPVAKSSGCQVSVTFHAGILKFRKTTITKDALNLQNVYGNINE